MALFVGFVGGSAVHGRRGAANVRRCAINGSDRSELLVVGCGRLGSRVGKLWVERHGEVVGETASRERHEELRSYGIEPRVIGEGGDRKFPNVLCSIPALRTTPVASYVQEVKRAVGLWSGDGGFIFTSSGGVYKESDGRYVNEFSETHERGHSERSDRLLYAEDAAYEADGTVLRLPGIYSRKTEWDHNKWIELAPTWGQDFCVNIIDVDDAATLIEAMFLRSDKLRGKTLLASSSSGLMQEVVNNVYIAQGRRDKVDDSPVKPRGMMYETSRTKSMTEWEPNFDLLSDIADTRGFRFLDKEQPVTVVAK